jgi:hypothetical protein
VVRFKCSLISSAAVFCCVSADAGILLFDTDRSLVSQGDAGGFWESASVGVTYSVTNGEFLGDSPTNLVDLHPSHERLVARFNLEQDTPEMPHMTARFDHVGYGQMTVECTREYQRLETSDLLGEPQPVRATLNWQMVLPPIQHGDGDLVRLERHLATESDTGGPDLGPVVVHWELIGSETVQGETMLSPVRLQSRGKLTLPHVVAAEGWDTRGAYLVERFDYYFLPQAVVLDEQIDGIGMTLSVPRISYATHGYGLPVPEPAALQMALVALWAALLTRLHRRRVSRPERSRGG